MSVFANVTIEMGTPAGLRHAQEPADRPLRPAPARAARLPADRHEEFDGPGRAAGRRCRFHELLNEFFRDVADAALECERGDPQICRRRGDPDLARGPRAGRRRLPGLPVRRPRSHRRRRRAVPRALRRGARVPRGAALRRDRRRRNRRRAPRDRLCRRHAERGGAPAGRRQDAGPRRAGLDRAAGAGDPAAGPRGRAVADARPCAAAPRRSASRRWTGSALDPDLRSSRLPRMPLGRKMMNSTSRTP